MKYLRGWNPKITDDFSPMIRIFIAKIVQDISEIVNIDEVTIRVNSKQTENCSSISLTSRIHLLI